MFSVERLARLVNVSPRRQVFDWAAIEASLGLSLPTDYKKLVEFFPDGRFQGAIRLNRPGDYDNPVTEYLGFYADKLGDMRSAREFGDGDFPYPIFPEQGGLLPWASGPNAEQLFWLTEQANPDSWPVVIVNSDFTRWEIFPEGACEFLCEVVEGKFDVSILGMGKRSKSWFEPIEPVRPAPPGRPGPFFWSMISAQPGNAQNEFSVLAEHLGPPPADVRPVEWGKIEQNLGFALPADYKLFSDTYGAGTIFDIRISTPNAPGGEFEFSGLLGRKYDQVRALERTEYDVPLYPEETGMVAWGETSQGYTLFWLPDPPSDPDSWGVVFSAPHPPTLSGVGYRPGVSFSSYLLLLFRDPAELAIDLGREEWPAEIRFEPYSDK